MKIIETLKDTDNTIYYQLHTSFCDICFDSYQLHDDRFSLSRGQWIILEALYSEFPLDIRKELEAIE